ncbi:MAG: anaerobic glycerol-3-phosphate dehydrogenase subunit C [Candidatus Bathyarchaeia archaeon]
MDPGRAKIHKQLLARVRKAVGNVQQKNALISATRRLKVMRQIATEEFDEFQDLKQRARDVKLKTLANLEFFLTQLTKNVEALGGNVFRAKTGEDVARYVIALARQHRVTLAVKSKSMTTEEIHLNDALEENGVKVIDTDLGERIVQLAQEKPSHLIAPAIHKTRYEIAQLFSKNLRREISPEPQIVTQEVRLALRNSFLTAKMGITGVNMAIAESGTIVLVTNEGNARLGTALPEIHVAVMGLEKVVPTFEDATTLLELLPRSATGQKLTSYVTMINGPNASASWPKELHLVLLDNGRSRALEDKRFEESLACIRCGACLNVCPTFKIVGGHVFGHSYGGPIGIPWTFFTASPEAAMEISPMCVACGLCEEACPIGINIPEMIMHVKADDVRKHGTSETNSSIGRIESFSKMASRTAPLSNWLLQTSFFRRMLEKTSGIDRRRPFPKYTRQTFSKWSKNRASLKSQSKVAYFVDLYAEYNDTTIGKAVTAILERNGIEVVMPPQRSSGMPYFSYGLVDRARELMEFNVNSLYDALSAGCKIVASESTAAYCLKVLYPEFLGGEKAEEVANHTYEMFEFLADLKRSQKLDLSFASKFSGAIGYHAPCHTKSIVPQKPVIAFLNKMGFEVVLIEEGCCGIAGTYGFKKGIEGYDVSMEIGNDLFNAIRESRIELMVTESSVCSMQIEAGTGSKVVHPSILLNNAYNA